MLNIKDLNKIKIFIAGDLLLDEYIFGTSDRLSPEAPVPIIKIKSSTMDYRLGGTGNVVNNLISLNVKTVLLGIIGDDISGTIINNMIQQESLIESYIDLIKEKYITPTKTRIISHNHHITRIDKELDEYKNPIIYSERYLTSIIKDSDLVLISDYEKGFLTFDLIRRIIKIAKNQNKKIIVDPKENFGKFSESYLLTPNLKEFELYCRVNIRSDEELSNYGRLASNEINSNILITLGSNGMVLFEINKDPYFINAETKNVFDVCGAGDTVVAIIAILQALNYSLKESCEIANKCAGLIVQKIGTSTLTLNEFKGIIDEL